MKECPSCKHSNTEESTFCVNCGAKLETQEDAPVTEAPSEAVIEPVVEPVLEPVTEPVIEPVVVPDTEEKPVENKEEKQKEEANVQTQEGTPSEEKSDLVPEKEVLNSGASRKIDGITNKNATYSLVCSIVAFFIFWWLAFAGISLGCTALNQIKNSSEKGRGLAIAGITIGVIDIVLFIIGQAMKFGS